MIKKTFTLAGGASHGAMFNGHCRVGKASAFPKPSRGTNEVRGERQSTETLSGLRAEGEGLELACESKTSRARRPVICEQPRSFRCWRERCRLTRGAAFTLAEVLITLGIIGVVAALTIPNITSHYRKKVAETRLAKFYTVMNQAIERSEVDNGPKEFWDDIGNGFVVDEEGNTDKTQSVVMPWYNKYLKNYLKVTDVKVNPVVGNLMLYFPDGSLALFQSAATQFWIDAKDFKEYGITESGNFKNNSELSGIKYFDFMLWPSRKTNKYAYKKGLEPFKSSSWDGRRETLLNDTAIGCRENVSNERAYCTALIQMNGWKIPDDYPLKF